MHSQCDAILTVTFLASLPMPNDQYSIILLGDTGKAQECEQLAYSCYAATPQQQLSLRPLDHKTDHEPTMPPGHPPSSETNLDAKQQRF